MALYTVKLPELQSTCADKAGNPSTPWTANYCIVQGSNSWWYRTFIKHDFSLIPPNAEIISATLRVYCLKWNTNGGSGTTNISRVTQDWDESTLTWNNQPSTTGTYLASNVKPPAVGSWTDWDITNLVTEWVSGTYPNYGLYIKNNNEGSYRVDWNISNHRNADGNASYIEVVYDWTYTSHFYYNGVLLPKLPEYTVDGVITSVIKDYPYCWIKEDITNACYELIFSKSPFYLQSNVSSLTSEVETVEDILCYKIDMAIVENAEEWVQYENTDIEFELNSDKTVLWSNHSILNGSATSETIYVHKSYMTHYTSDDTTELSYGGTVLPKLPTEVLTEYPYCWISPANKLVVSTHPWYYAIPYMMISESVMTKVYALSELNTEWVLEKSSINYGEYNLLNSPKWTSHDIPNNTYESSDIYLSGSDAEPVIDSSSSGAGSSDGGNKIYSHTIDFSNEFWTTARPDVFTITNGNTPFYVNTTFTYEGKPTFRSGSIGHSGTTETTINFSLIREGSVEFNYTVSSENNYDKLWVYVDNTQVICVSGSVNWTVYTKSLSVGNHTIKFRYTKDGSGNRGNDAGAIGYITFTGVQKEFDQMYLVRYDNVIYSMVNDVLSPIDTTELTSVDFLECGFYDCPTWEQLSNFTNPEILYWFDSDKYTPVLNVNMIASPPTQIIISNPIDLTDPTITGIESATIICEGNVVFSVSFDDKQTWKAWNGEQWSSVSEEFSGMTKELFESITYDDWLPLYMESTNFYIKAILSEADQSITQVYIDFAN